MKKLTILLYFIINIGVVFSQTNINSISFYIDKDTISYYLSEIDSISHYENQAVNVWSNNICYKNLVNEIDSICFEYKEKHTYYQIPKESLEGWEEGCMDSNGCFIVCRKEMSDGGYFCFIGEKGREDRGIALKFDKDMNIQTIFSNQGLLNVFADERTNQQYGFFTTSDSAYIKELDGVKNIKPLNAVTRVPNGEVLNIICRWINNAFEINDILTLFSNGSEYLPGFLLSQGLTAGIWGYSQPVALGINLLLGWLEHNYEENYNNLLYDYIGGPMIWISDIDNNNAPQYKIQVNIEGLNTLGKPITCSIHTGVAIRRNESNVNYDNCDFRLKEHEIKFDESYLANLNAEPKIYYWLRPYAVVMVDGFAEQFVLRRQKYLWGGPQEPIITYGDVDKIYYDIQPKVTTGEVLNVTEEAAAIVCSFSHVPNGATCGVQYGNDGNSNIVTTSSYDGERTVNLSGLQPGTTYKYRAFIQYEGENYYGETKSFTTKPIGKIVINSIKQTKSYFNSEMFYDIEVDFSVEIFDSKYYNSDTHINWNYDVGNYQSSFMNSNDFVIQAPISHFTGKATLRFDKLKIKIDYENQIATKDIPFSIRLYIGNTVIKSNIYDYKLIYDDKPSITAVKAETYSEKTWIWGGYLDTLNARLYYDVKGSLFVNHFVKKERTIVSNGTKEEDETIYLNDGEQSIHQGYIVTDKEDHTWENYIRCVGYSSSNLPICSAKTFKIVWTTTTVNATIIE